MLQLQWDRVLFRGLCVAYVAETRDVIDLSLEGFVGAFNGAVGEICQHS